MLSPFGATTEVREQMKDKLGRDPNDPDKYFDELERVYIVNLGRDGEWEGDFWMYGHYEPFDDELKEDTVTFMRQSVMPLSCCQGKRDVARWYGRAVTFMRKATKEAAVRLREIQREMKKHPREYEDQTEEQRARMTELHKEYRKVIMTDNEKLTDDDWMIDPFYQETIDKMESDEGSE